MTADGSFDRVARLARRQHGLITRQQAVAAGATPGQIRGWLERGIWEALRFGVYGWAGAPVSYERAVHAAVLASGPGAVASHHTAACLHGLGPRPREGIDVLVRRNAAPQHRGVVGHRTRVLPASDVSRASGVPATSAARTLVDISAWLGPDRLGRLLDDAARARLLSVEGFERCAAALIGEGEGRNLAEVRRALELRVPGSQPGDSFLEKRALRWLRQAGLPPPMQQHEVWAGSPPVPYRIDLAYPAAMVAIELDGFDPHSGRSAFDHDRARARHLVLSGWTLLAFTWTTTQDDFSADVGRALRCARALEAAGGIH